MLALLSALSVRDGRIFWTRCTPAAVMFLQKSTCRVCKESAWKATASRVWSVIRTQFSNWRVRRPRQLLRSSTMESSVTWPHPESFRDRRLGHLKVEARKVTRGGAMGGVEASPAASSFSQTSDQLTGTRTHTHTLACKDFFEYYKKVMLDLRGMVKPERDENLFHVQHLRSFSGFARIIMVASSSEQILN